MSIAQQVAEVRNQIEATKQRRAELDAMPQSRSEQHAAVRAWCDRTAADPARLLAARVRSVAHGQPLDGALVVRSIAPGAPIDVAPLLAALLGPETLAQHLVRFLEGAPEGVSAEQRAARHAEINAELFALELAEERLIENSEAEGAPIARRGDADPRAVLWVDADDEQADTLPGPPTVPTNAEARHKSTPASERRRGGQSAPSRYLTQRHE